MTDVAETSNMSSPVSLLDALTAGIDFSLPGNGGPDCLHYISSSRRLLEDLSFFGLSLLCMIVGIWWHTSPPRQKELEVEEPFKYR